MLSALSPTVVGLEFSEHIPSASSHEIDGVARGLGVHYEGVSIVGEGMGIGAPLALLGNKAVFPLDSQRLRSGVRLTKRFHLNGLSFRYMGAVRAEFPYKWIRTTLAPLYMKSPRFRPIFNYLMAARTVVGIKSHYRKTPSIGHVDVSYSPSNGKVRVEVDASNLRTKRFLVANELDGRLFNRLVVDDATYVSRIPPWLEVTNNVRLVAPELGLSFRLNRLDGCRLFVGREIVGGRLNWAGGSYMPGGGTNRFSYEVVFEKND